MTIFAQKPACILYFLCLPGLIMASPALAESRWSTSNRDHQTDHYKFKKDRSTGESNKWRADVKYKKSEVEHNRSDKPGNRHDSRNPGHSQQQQRDREKHRSQSQYTNSQRKKNDDSQQERGEYKKHQQRSSDFRDYKDKPPSQHEVEIHKEPRNEKQKDHSHREQHKQERDTRHSREAAPVVVRHEKEHRSGHKPKYNLYNRHQHIYYRTPWYSTRYVAPIHYHYHPVGHHVHSLPHTHVRIVVGGFPYFYFGGVFYRSFNSGYVVVSAPIGAVVHTLPIGFIAFTMGVATFYHVNDTYYIWDEPREAYVVVEKPEGADKAIADATTGRLFIYPKEGQSEEQQAKDRYECHRWAVTESRVDPTLEDKNYSDEQKQDYQRAMGACLEGRGYTVK
jgi:hypothetical protein